MKIFQFGVSVSELASVNSERINPVSTFQKIGLKSDRSEPLVNKSKMNLEINDEDERLLMKGNYEKHDGLEENSEENLESMDRRSVEIYHSKNFEKHQSLNDADYRVPIEGNIKGVEAYSLDVRCNMP